jgi:sugar transferase EpsL
MMQDRIKRAIDVTVALLVLIVCSPVVALASLAIAVRLGRPVLFVQTRPGRNGEPFAMRKFRTMREAYDAAGRPLPDEERLTPLGEFLRATSIDELPTLVNVLRGEMSLVGPRPLLMEYLDIYTPEQARRLNVLPGITGWAQVNGRNAISYEQTFELDVWYVEHRSVPLDLRILAMTAAKIVRRDGCVARKELWQLEEERYRLTPT